MRNLLAATILLCSFLPLSAYAETVTISPENIYQGDPVMITVPDASTTDIYAAAIDGQGIRFTSYRGMPAAFYGIDINHPVGTTTVRVYFKDGSQATTTFYVRELPRPSEFLAIPAQIGGNSQQNQARVLSILKKDNADLSTYYYPGDARLWVASGTQTFSFPVASTTDAPLVVTNGYGYERNSGSASIIHKGTDFRAPPGTPVYAINDGIVRASKTYYMYGGTVIVDHGLDIVSMYMHMSKMIVTPGEMVQRGQLIGYSGETGYSEGPHLHLTIRIGRTSIDPMKFFSLFGVE